MRTWLCIALITVGSSGGTSAQFERLSFAAQPYSPVKGVRDVSVTVPENILAEPEYRALLATMLTRSSSFRRQCERIAGERGLTVHLRHLPVRLAGGVRAIGHISRHPGGAVVAHVVIHPFDNHVEMIAHEFEHIIEQLDEVNLAKKAKRSDSGVWANDRVGAVFETRRAQLVGRMVVEEFRRRDRQES